MGRKQKMRIALLLAALVALSALWGLAEPARKTLTIQLEGMPEEMPWAFCPTQDGKDGPDGGGYRGTPPPLDPARPYTNVYLAS